MQTLELQEKFNGLIEDNRHKAKLLTYRDIKINTLEEELSWIRTWVIIMFFIMLIEFIIIIILSWML